MTPQVIAGAARIVSQESEQEYYPIRIRSHGMDGIREFLETVRDEGLSTGHFRGLLHIAIGRKITRANGDVVAAGLTWREVAGYLKLLRFDKDLVREFGVEPESLAPRDRSRFWYSAIAQAKVDSPEAVAEAERLAFKLRSLGFIIGPSPTAAIPPPTPPAPAKPHAEHKPAPRKANPPPPEEKSTRRKKK